jgi:hypothetical protein
MGGYPSFQSIAASISAATNIAKALISADKTFEKAELKLKLADLMVSLAEARTESAEMQDVVYRLTDELDEAKKMLAFAGTMRFGAPYYWNVADGGRDGPFCATCWDGREHLAIRLYEAQTGFWVCHTCKNRVQDGRYRDLPNLEPTEP